MKSFFTDAKFILAVLAIVTAISGVSNLDLDSDQKPSFEKSDLSSGFLVVEKSTARPSRSMASVESTTSQVVVQNFFCNHTLDEKINSATVGTQMVMLNFKICKDMKNISSVSLYNKTNGFKAQIFKTDNFNYKTDFIQLDHGTNNITVEVVLKDGQKKQDSLVILTGS